MARHETGLWSVQVPSDETAVRSTAEARPTAYISPDLGIPVPFGQFAPFKPTGTAQAERLMRHHTSLAVRA